MKYSYKIHRNINKDAWNWWDACNSINFGVDWSLRVDPQVAKKIKIKTQKQALKFLIPYLRKKYQQENKKLQWGYHNINKELNQKFFQACDKIVQVMEKPLCRQDFHFFLTTFPSITYDKEKGYIWLNYYWNNPIDTFLHELCHLQFIHYWRENSNSPVFKLTKDQFEFLKESLTMILDESFFPLIKKPDQGYDIHQRFRKKLIKFWKQEKNFDKLVEFGVRQILATK